jgi:NADH dehydrogenase
MKRIHRRAAIGAVAGAVASTPLVAALGHIAWVLLLGVVLGAAFSILTGPTPGAYLDNMMTAGAYGVPLWAVISVIAVPVLSGQMPEWGAQQMRSHFPVLVGWVLFGVTLGFCTQLLNDVAARWLGPEAAPQEQVPTATKRIVILGGGFAGMKVAECLERELERNRSVSISLVSETNALLFTPMLAEVAGSSLEPSHISTPLRTTLHRTEFVRARVTGVDLENKKVSLDSGNGAESCKSELAYDHLVFALGAVSNYLGLSNVQRLAFDFKSLIDAIRIRNHVIEMFERADRESDPEARKPLLTFVVAGGGFAGVELAGAMNDFARGILADYPNLRAEDVRVVLVHSRGRILPELSESLGRYAQKRMEMRGVEFR